MKLILEHVREYHREIVSTLRQLVEKESFTTDKQGVDELGHWISTKAEEVGMKYRVFPQSTVGDHILAELGQCQEQVLILCHSDTVWPPGTIKHLPFRVEANRAFGPGVLDMKAGLTIAFHAIKALRDLGLQPKRKVKILFTTDEETDSSTSRAIIEKESERSKYVFCLEPAFGKHGALKTARKGAGWFDVRIFGRAAHAGNDPENGISASEELAHQIIRLHRLNNTETGTTVTVGIAKSGTVRNQIAAYGEAWVDVRVVTHEEGGKVTRTILGLKPVLPGAKVEVTGRIEQPPMPRTEERAKLFSKVRDIALGLDMNLQEASVGGGSDAQFAAALGVPVLDGLGGVGEGPHSESEYVFVDSLYQRTALLASLLTEL